MNQRHRNAFIMFSSMLVAVGIVGGLFFVLTAPTVPIPKGFDAQDHYKYYIEVKNKTRARLLVLRELQQEFDAAEDAVWSAMPHGE